MSESGKTTGVAPGSDSAPDPDAAPPAGAALAFIALALALTGQYVLRQGPPFSWKLLLGSAVAYSVAAVAFLWLVGRGRDVGERGLAAAGEDELAATATVVASGGGSDLGADRGRERADESGDGAARAGPVTTVLRSVRGKPMSWALVFTALFLSFEIAITLWNRGDLGPSYWDVFALWLLSIALYLLPFVRPWRALSATRLRDGGRRLRQPLLDSAILFALALALRLPRLGTIPDVFGGDEGIVGEVSRTMAERAGNMFATMFAYGQMYYLIIGVPLSLMGSTAQAVRIPSAVGGALAAAATYLAGRELFGRRTGLVAGALIAVAHMHIHVSRTAHGQALDTLLAAAVIFSFARGLKRSSLPWMAVAGVFLGLSQYIYVAARMIDVIVAVFVVVLAVTDHRLWRRSLGGFAVAFGAALVTAAPMVVWALRRPGDYLARISSVGFVQTGDLAGELETTGGQAWKVVADQVGTAILVPVALPARAFYDATIPMLDLAWAALLVLGLVLALRRFRDWRYLLLLMFVLGGIAVLALGNLIDVAAYRITVIMPVFAILAAHVLVLLIERGLSGLGARPRVVAFAIAAAVAIIAVRNVGYYFFDHVQNCRYMDRDAATAAVSMATRYVAESAPDAVIYSLTEPEFHVGAFPNSKFYTVRDTRNMDDPEAPAPTGAEGKHYIYSVGPEYAFREHLATVGPDETVVIMASPGRFGQLRSLAALLPGGKRVPLIRCGIEIMEIYHRPGTQDGDGPGTQNGEGPGTPDG